MVKWRNGENRFAILRFTGLGCGLIRNDPELLKTDLFFGKSDSGLLH